jgi:hypothetical protein
MANKRKKIHIGQWYSNGNKYILANVDSFRVALINLQTGLHWSDSVYVENAGDITDEEVRQICDGDEFMESI